MVLSGPPLGAVQSREMCPFNIESVILRQANTMRRLAYEFTTSIALHGLSLTVTSVVVGPSTFVARRRAGSTSHSSSEAAAISTARHHSATASSGPRLQSCTRTRTLCNRLSFPPNLVGSIYVQQDDLVGRKYSSDRRTGHHSGVGSGNQLAHGPDPDSGNTAWLEPDCQS